ncbi:MAG: SOS response-associated peptidase [Phycisphaerae bacterium]
MCGRFTLANPAAAFKTMPWLREIPATPPRCNIAPGQLAAIIWDPLAPRARTARWGFPKTWTSATSELLINARSEKVLETSTFAEAFRQRRCVIPADGFYEWRKTSVPAEPFLFQLSAGAPFCLAGLYNYYGAELNFVILTTTANAVVRHVHPRMPVMIPPAEAMAYISAPAEAPETRRFFQPYPANGMNFHRVSPLVNRVENDSRACMDMYQPSPDKQSGLFQ